MLKTNDLKNLLDQRSIEFYTEKNYRKDQFSEYTAGQTMLNNHKLDKLYYEIWLLKDLIAISIKTDKVVY